jgi:cytochrome c-type biogenesis protein CcmE
MKFGAMKPHRRNQLLLICVLVLGLGLALTFTLRALDSNINLFYAPAEIKNGIPPIGKRIRAGGMVKAKSVRRASDSLEVQFEVTDLKGADFEVRYTGILPDLFREGQGVVATGTLGSDGVFSAEEILAKHDEKYMPPEVAMVIEGAENPGVTAL